MESGNESVIINNIFIGGNVDKEPVFKISSDKTEVHMVGWLCIGPTGSLKSLPWGIICGALYDKFINLFKVI